MDLSLQQINYIISVAENKNFSRASEQCFVTQPTLSMQIKKAEETLGFKIFNRNRNPVELSEKGTELLPSLYELKESFQAIIHFSQKAQGKFKEELKIGIIPTIAAYMVPFLFSNATIKNQKNQKIVIKELKTDEILKQIVEKKIDMGIMAGPLSMKTNLSSIPLYNEEILVYFPSFKKKELRIEDINNVQPWLLNDGNCLRTQMIQFCKIQDKQNDFEWNYEGGNIEMLIKMVNDFGGYTLVPDFYKNIFLKNVIPLKSIRNNLNNLNPARNVIAVTTQKNKTNINLLNLTNVIKQGFYNKENKNLEILSWD
jgi:LysR family transcriptional regulator, hydrogen peroxide-inducible genes activator